MIALESKKDFHAHAGNCHFQLIIGGNENNPMI